MKIFVSATRCKKSNQIEFVQLVATTKFCYRDKNFHKNSESSTCNWSPDLYTPSHLLPGLVAATCRLVCTDLKTFIIDLWISQVQRTEVS